MASLTFKSRRRLRSNPTGILPISYVVTSYNNRQTVGSAIASILAQTWPVAEILVADDNSDDGSQDLLLEIAERHSTVRLILRTENLGIAANRDLAIRAATQPFVTHLDGDDLAAAHKVAAEWDALRGREDLVAYSFVARIIPGSLWRSSVLDPRPTVSGSQVQNLKRLLSRCTAIPRDMLLSKQLYMDTGGYQHGINLYEDWQFKMRLAMQASQWRATGALGTLYFQRGRGLSAGPRVDHLRSCSTIVFADCQRFLEYLEPGDLLESLGAVFGRDLNAMLPEHRETMLRLLDYPVLQDYEPPGQSRVTGLAGRLRLLRFLPQITQAITLTGA